jgi:hypothetical protein
MNQSRTLALGKLMVTRRADLTPSIPPATLLPHHMGCPSSSNNDSNIFETHMNDLSDLAYCFIFLM